jgi:ATP-dependent helicase/nuclease subunit A
MSSAAYQRNGQAVSPEKFYSVACDPTRSVVVEACAGAGKTWMLVSRILRALMDGCEPAQILAITFTRKAAGEMRERLQQWLREMAQQTHVQRCAELMARGMTADEAHRQADALAALYGRWLCSGESVQISTIHGWFSKLVSGMPMDVLAELGLPPQWQLIEDQDELWPQLWGLWLKQLDAEQSTPARAAFEWLLTVERRSNLEAWLRSALNNRMELHLAQQAGVLWDSVPSAAEEFAAFEGLDQPAQALARSSVHGQFEQLGRELGQLSGKKPQVAAQQIVSAMLIPVLDERAKALSDALLTAKGEPRKQLGDGATLAWAQAWLVDFNLAVLQQGACDRHRAMVLLAQVLFEQYARLKHQRGLADIVDLELAAARLLQDPALAGWVQERLDVQLRHVLMDEFQDTSPLQWATLHAWLSGYVGAGGGASGRAAIQVFVVGDPKQSIYRFRRADPRVFEAAKAFVQEGLEGDLLACDHTRRNAPGIIDLINQTLAPAALEGVFKGYRPHTTASTAQAEIRVLPDVLRPPKPASDTSEGGDPVDPLEDEDLWRDSLTEPRHEAAEVLKQLEAEHCAAAIAHAIEHEGRVPGDIFVLARRRANLVLVAKALAHRGIAHAAPENTLLVETPEARDLMAVMQCVVTPGQDLALAHALKTPALGASDQVLMALARCVKAAKGTTWWDALMRLDGQAAGLDSTDQACVMRAQSLLPIWQQAARTLPPHDLLQQIVDDAGWRQALARCLSPSMLRQALVNLDALLAQSLALHAGRHATPYRWLRELKRLREPLPSQAVKEAVQLLTIHGAKGLEAPVVFLLDTDSPASRSDHHTVLVDWPQGAQHPQRCAFVAREAVPAPSLQSFMQDEKLAQLSEECNALYVALTRAREQLVISRTEPRSSNAQGSWWARLWRSDAVHEGHRWAPPEPASDHHLGVSHAWHNTLPMLPSLPPRKLPKVVDAGPDESALDQVMSSLTGQALHRVMELLTPLPLARRTADLLATLARQATQSLVNAQLEQGLDAEACESLIQSVLQTAQRILAHPATQPWLDPQQASWAGNEVVIWHEGQVLRIDRLVTQVIEGQTHWWVLDYKLHPAPHLQPAYRAQIEQYVRAIKAVERTEHVRGAFIAGDGGFHPL